MNPFGFILSARNIDTPDQVRALCDDYREAVAWECPITIDQEGGRVQRLRSPTWRKWVPPWTLSPRLALAHELRDIGIDSNCAPMVDVANTETHPFLRNCCYGTDVLTVAAMGCAVADGLLDGGVCLSSSISWDMIARPLTAILTCPK